MPFFRRYATALIGLSASIAIVATIALSPPFETTDSCKLPESQARKLWVTAWMHANGSEAARVRIAADLVRQSENLCREWRDAKPAPLPAELQRLAR